MVVHKQVPYYAEHPWDGYRAYAHRPVIVHRPVQPAPVVVYRRHSSHDVLGGLIVGIVALGVIVLSMFMGFNLGIIFVAAMLLLAGGYILYDTSNILHHYRIGQHVAASLALFASVALMFWYMGMIPDIATLRGTTRSTISAISPRTRIRSSRSAPAPLI